jgi:AraC family transcriptional regulator
MPRAARAATRRPSIAQRLDRVLDHVADHLDDKLALEKLARVAGFSPFHFHRLFQAHAGESVHDHVRRIRVERAASLMRSTPSRPLTAIALDVGFPALSDLSRAFKQRFAIAPSKWDRRSPLPESRDVVAGRIPDAELAKAARDLRVRIRELPRSLFVFTRVANPYGNQRLVDVYHATRSWLDSLGRPASDVIFAGMSIDDPAVTPAKLCRYDLGVLFPYAATTGVVTDLAKLRGSGPRIAAPTPAEVERGGFSVRWFPALELATVHVTGDLAAVDVVWQWLYRTWFPGQRRLPANLPAMELFVKLPEEIGWEQFDLVAAVPLSKI